MNKQSVYDNIQFVKNWFRDRQTLNVSFVEDKGANDSTYESNILWEIRFEPLNPYGLRVELWFADDGTIGFGIDRRDRVAKLIGIKAHSRRFVGGREPAPMSLGALQMILDLVADGRISVSILHLPLLGLISTKLFVGQEEYRLLESSGFVGVRNYFSRWPLPFARVLNFERWS